MNDIPLNSSDLAWLGGLARSLLREPNAADDLVQETMLAALTGEPPAGPRRRFWLSSVARKLAARHHRTLGRRRRREERSAIPITLPDSTELVGRTEVIEQVLHAVRNLREPFRRTILLQFLEGHSAATIAQRENVPADTIRWRVRRGLQLLREDLVEGERRDWASWCVLLEPLAGLTSGTGISTAAGSGVHASAVLGLLTMKTFLLATVATITIGAAAWWAWPETPAAISVSSPTEPAAVADVDPSRAPVIERTDLAGAAASPEPSEPSTPAPIEASDSEPDLPPEPGFRLAGRVIDESGNGVAARLALFPPSREALGAQEALAETNSNSSGFFRWLLEEDDLPDAFAQLDLSAIANGYLRTALPGVESRTLSEELVVVMKRGATLSGRVVDRSGNFVPNLRLLAHSSRAFIDHVSPSQVALRAQRAVLGNPSSRYEQCLASTDDRGFVTFRGLAEGNPVVRSLDPGWEIVSARNVSTEDDDRFILWIAEPCLAVEVTAVDPETGEPVERASATFRAVVDFADGERAEWGQWVGRGPGVVTFRLNESVAPELRDRTVTSLTFYGTVSAFDREWPWRAAPLDDPAVRGGVARVSVPLRPTEVEPVLPMSTLELTVRMEDDTSLFAGTLSVQWTVVLDDRTERQGRTEIEPSPNGNYQLTLPAGLAYVSVEDRDASGSMREPRLQITCPPDATEFADAAIPRGAAVTLARPTGWTDRWMVLANWRESDQDEWRTTRKYSPTEASLRLTALRPGVWRFRALRYAQDSSPAEQIVIVASGDDRAIDWD